MKAVSDSGNQFHLQLSYPAEGYNAPRELALQMLVRTLDDGPATRLPQVIRERHALVYYVGAGYAAYWDAGSVDISTVVSTDRLEALLDRLPDELSRFRREGPTPDEVDRARMRHLFELEFERDSLSARIGRHAWPLLYSTVRTEDEERELVGEVSTPALAELAAEILAPERAKVVLVGPVTEGTRRLLDQAVKRL